MGRWKFFPAVANFELLAFAINNHVAVRGPDDIPLRSMNLHAGKDGVVNICHVRARDELLGILERSLRTNFGQFGQRQVTGSVARGQYRRVQPHPKEALLDIIGVDAQVNVTGSHLVLEGDERSARPRLARLPVPLDLSQLPMHARADVGHDDEHEPLLAVEEGGMAQGCAESRLAQGRDSGETREVERLAPDIVNLVHEGHSTYLVSAYTGAGNGIRGIEAIRIEDAESPLEKGLVVDRARKFLFKSPLVPSDGLGSIFPRMCMSRDLTLLKLGDGKWSRRHLFV
mmetsp:Transcript_18905/g.35140  ORF Transcript_18905/g.35140 Transcript_18905/m.35140 type:complete len:286 (+) Transcript_18905:222-1079(+)